MIFDLAFESMAARGRYRQLLPVLVGEMPAHAIGPAAAECVIYGHTEVDVQLGFVDDHGGRSRAGTLFMGPFQGGGPGLSHDERAEQLRRDWANEGLVERHEHDLVAGEDIAETEGRSRLAEDRPQARTKQVLAQLVHGGGNRLGLRCGAHGQIAGPEQAKAGVADDVADDAAAKRLVREQPWQVQ